MATSQTDGNLANAVLFDNLSQYGDNTALLAGEQSYSYRQLAEMTAAYARQLRELGIKPGERVLMAMPDSLGFVGIFFAILSIGAVAVPMAPGASREEAEHIVDKTDCRLALVDTLCPVQTLNHCPVHVIDSRRLPPSTTTGDDFRAISCEPQALAYILFSSGSTGPAKGIPHRHVDLLHCAKAYADTVIKYQSQDVVLCVPKLSFGYALGCNLVFPLLAGAAVTLIEALPTTQMLKTVAEQTQPTIFIGQPRNLPGILDSGSQGAFSRLRIAVVAGEKLSPALATRFAQVFPSVPLLDGYGTTEANAIFLTNTPETIREKSLGKVVPGFDVKLLTPQDGRPAADGEVGELWFRGPSACVAYWNDAGATEQRIKDGWIRTGDLFVRDSDGYYFLQGRQDHMLKVGCGDWINPTTVEAVIQQVETVEECAVVGYPDEDGVIQLKAFVLLINGVRQTRSLRDEILQTVKDHFAGKPSHHVKVVEFVSSFPRTSTGKLHRQKLTSHTQLEFAYQC